ncbi:hypothetical protein DM01DRAFT_1055042 [Hesseltinella vesiculosa]|uniref:C2H2-type domain-containing protein n=1 Tax=Hesseltinella vesiculosa TaxID=101127 RepID=A0A1X2GFL4_9FUNG|nr:hypothetical protein DM01DRAFT_1055042 [Hesseltinella vesiculosa]
MFKRINKELAKQSIVDTEFDPEADQDQFVGLSSEDEDSEPESYVESSLKRSRSDSDDDESDQDSNNDNSDDESDEEEEGVLVYMCDICPDKKMQSEEQVKLHLQSKQHLRRNRFLQKQSLDSLPAAKRAKIDKKREKRRTKAKAKAEERKKSKKASSSKSTTKDQRQNGQACRYQGQEEEGTRQ